ncbi:hypothetical protein TWF694_002388 [Orbilia ellipsospora]|uniref:tRNA/rRNA methyltransferase SpoU type domain-containing protein n=1 Tax=Orbilia ellipsospora TaxID=2528407 RepID=A0AAV9X316_9PEZI
MADLPSTTALLENLQNDPKSLDTLAYLLELQADNKTGSVDQQVSKLVAKLYSFAFYQGSSASNLRQRLSEVIEFLRKHEKLSLRKNILSTLIPETTLLIRLCILNCKDEYESEFSYIYSSVPKVTTDLNELRGRNGNTLGGKLDIDAEAQNIELEVEERLRPVLGTKLTIFEATKDRLLFLEDLLSDQDDSFLPFIQSQPSLTSLLMRICTSATYVTDQSIILSSVRLLRRINHINNRAVGESVSNDTYGLDSAIFKHVESLLQSNHQMQINAGYHLWVGFLESHSESFDLGSIIHGEKYWENILKGLDEASGEIKKISLHILWSTLQQLNSSLELRNFKWNIHDKLPLLEFWKTYITFTEILALDSSVNQFRLASPELEKLLQSAKTLHIPNDWILVLLSQGFRNSTTGDMPLRLSEFVLRLDNNALWWVKEESSPEKRSSLDFLRKILFPQVSRTTYFNVSVLAPNICEHGNSIAKFVTKIISMSQCSENILQSLIEVCLDAVLDHVGQSNASQFYILKGIHDAIFSQETRIRLRCGEKLVKIANIPVDNVLRSDMKVSICLLLFLRLESPMSERNMEGRLESISDIIRNHPHLLDERNSPLIIKALKLDSSQLSQILEKQPIGQARPSNIGLCSLIVALSLQTSKPSFILRYPPKGPASYRTDLYASILMQLLKYRLPLARELQTSSEVQESVTKNFREIFDQGTHIHHDQNIASLIPLLGAQEKSSIQQSAMAVLQDISENWTAGFTNIEELLDTLKFYLRLCVYSKSENTPGECPDGVINAIVARTASFCEEVYDKVKRKRDFHEVISCFLELIQIMMNTREKLPTDLGYYILTTLHNSVLQYVDGTGYSIILDCIERVLITCPQALQMVDDLNELLQEWATKADEDRLGRNQKSNQVKAIGIILHPIILDASVATGPTLIKICKDFLKHMAKRRGLAPALARALCRAFDVTPSTFCREHGFTEILHEFLVPIGPKKEDNNFDVEDALAVIFDEVTGTQGSYEKYHGDKEIVAQARIFDLLARFDYDDAIQELWAKTLLDEVFEPWTEIDPKDPASLKIVQKWKKTQQLQTVLLLERFITDDDADDHLEAIFTALSREANPRYKFLLEWMAFRCILRFPNLRNEIWERFETTEDDIPSYTVSLLRLAYLISIHIKDEQQEEFFTELVNRALPCATSNKVTVRHEGAELIPKLFEEAKKLGYTKLTGNHIFKRIYEYAMESTYRKVMVPSPTESFDPIQDFSLVGVLAGPYITCDTGGDIISLFFEEDFKSFGAENMKRFIPIGDNPPTTPNSTGHGKDIPKSQDSQLSLTAAGPIQTKGGDWDIKNLLQRQDALQGRFATRRQSHNIEVIASLVDNNYNLGGICRVCELSGVKTLYMSNKTTVFKSKEFTSVSVSAENWLPIEETRATDVSALLAAKRREGYMIVGIEQTDRSTILGSKDFVFPERTVLLIGAEKTGIPPELLAEMDICLEVKQFGETRSMNVQTATAVVLYEYVRQNGGIQ